jgi:putative oxidoreductase
MEVTRFLPLFGRILIGLPFLVSGLGKLAAFGPTTAYISGVGLPLAPLGWAIAVASGVEPCGVHAGSGDLLSP